MLAGSGTAVAEKLSIARPASLPTSLTSCQRTKTDWPTATGVLNTSVVVRAAWFSGSFPLSAPLVVTGVGPTRSRLVMAVKPVATLR